MRRLGFVFAVLLSCSAPAASPSASPTTTASASAAAPASESPTATPTPGVVLRDLSVVAAGELRGDHAPVGNFDDTGRAGGAGANRVWDVPLDGSPARSLVAYSRGGRELSGYFGTDLSRQLSSDGRRIVLNDPVDVVGRALVVIDLIAGTARVIPTLDAADQPSWSPDGQRIAYRGFGFQGPLVKESGVWVVSASGGAPRQVWV